MHSLRISLVALTALAFLLRTENRLFAETLPAFDLHRRTAEAELIVQGRLDPGGKLTVDATLKGKTTAKHLALTNGKEVFVALNALEKQARSIEVVAYLRKANGKWSIGQGEHGVVGFLGNGICLVHEEGGVLRLGGAALGRHPTLLREPFLKSAHAAVVAFERRKLLLSLPASADRMGKIVAYWLELAPDAEHPHEGELSRALLPLSPVEERTLVALLKSSDADSRPRLLRLVRSTARGKPAFDAVADLLDRRQSKAVRQAAMDALAHIDANLAQERLLPLLQIDEPELRIVLLVLRWSDPSRLNPAVVEPLRKLTVAMRRLHRDDREALPDESYVLVDVLEHYAHPKLLPSLIEWAHVDTHVTSERADSALRRLTGHSPREEATAFEKWWKQAKPLLEATDDLRRTADRRTWYHAFRSSDSPTRALLMRLWSFEPVLNERAMVREAGREGGEIAKMVLARLWERGRLSGDAKSALVEKFLTVRLEEVPDQPITAYRHLRIVGEKHFPFPPMAWVHWRASIVIGNEREPTLDGSDSSSSLGEGTGLQSLGSMSGGSYPGTPKAKALLELWEVERSGPPRVAWKREWKLKPIRLSEAK